MSEQGGEFNLPDLSGEGVPVPSIAKLEAHYSKTLIAPDPVNDDPLSDRFCKVSLPNGFDHHKFIVDRPLLDFLSQHVADPNAPTQAEFLQCAVEQPAKDTVSSAVIPEFRPDALNAINASYFSSPIAFTEEADLANMYAKNKTINQVFGVLMAGAAQDGWMRVKELCSGANIDHWEDIAEGADMRGVHAMGVTLTDFVMPQPVRPPANLMYTAEKYSLFDSFETLPPDTRYDALIATYGFDSVWLPEDIFLTRDQNKWYQTLFRVKVADWHPRQAELLEAMRQGRALANASVSDYEGIAVEELRQPFDLDAHPYAEYLAAVPERRFNFPGGLIRRVVEAFDRQLTEDGIFISADVGNFGHDPRRLHYPTFAVSGVAAHYHVSDFVVASKILQDKFGLDAQLCSLEEITDYALLSNWRHPDNRRDRDQIMQSSGNGVMIVSRYDLK
ncbi:MAG TPA: hypothetical protein VF733_01625 [Candidatus Saccharimonadales bacterium]